MECVPIENGKKEESENEKEEPEIGDRGIRKEFGRICDSQSTMSLLGLEAWFHRVRMRRLESDRSISNPLGTATMQRRGIYGGTGHKAVEFFSAITLIKSMHYTRMYPFRCIEFFAHWAPSSTLTTLIDVLN